MFHIKNFFKNCFQTNIIENLKQISHFINIKVTLKCSENLFMINTLNQKAKTHQIYIKARKCPIKTTARTL